MCVAEDEVHETTDASFMDSVGRNACAFPSWQDSIRDEISEMRRKKKSNDRNLNDDDRL